MVIPSGKKLGLPLEENLVFLDSCKEMVEEQKNLGVYGQYFL